MFASKLGFQLQKWRIIPGQVGMPGEVVVPVPVKYRPGAVPVYSSSFCGAVPFLVPGCPAAKFFTGYPGQHTLSQSTQFCSVPSGSGHNSFFGLSGRPYPSAHITMCGMMKMTGWAARHVQRTWGNRESISSRLPQVFCLSGLIVDLIHPAAGCPADKDLLRSMDWRAR